MSYLLFLDESGVDQRQSPYEVLAGVAVQDAQLWNLICRVHDAEVALFGQRVTEGALELKAKKLLKRKTFRLAGQLPELKAERRAALAASCLDKGRASRGRLSSGATREELTALAQAKLVFVRRILELCSHHQVHAFASIVPRSAPRTSGDFLRKDYAHLFERFFYFLEERPLDELGLVVFDELERSRCHMLVGQMTKYFRETATGRARAGRIIPEPFFVHSELTTAVQLADLVAYIVAWGVRFGPMTAPARPELETLASLVGQLRFRVGRGRDGGGKPRGVWSFTVIDDLRPRFGR